MANPKKILLVEDDDIFLFTATFVLNKAFPNAEIAIKHHGQEALDYLMDHEPDLLFLDLNMPKMNGWEFLEAYEKLNLNQKGKVVLVMLTTSMNPDDRKKAETIKSLDGFISKPLTVEAINDLIATYLD